MKKKHQNVNYALAWYKPEQWDLRLPPIFDH